MCRQRMIHQSIVFLHSDNLMNNSVSSDKSSKENFIILNISVENWIDKSKYVLLFPFMILDKE